MSRVFLTRQEWPLVAAGIMAGVLTAAVMIYVFVTGIGGDGGAAGDSTLGMSAVSEDTSAAPAPAGQARRGAVIGAREGSVMDRLAAMPVSARRITGPLALTARDLVWNETDGTRFMTADVVWGNLDTGAAQNGDILLNGVTLQRPVVALRETSSGWNWERVFEELLEGEGAGAGGPTRTVQVRNVTIVNGDVEIDRPVQNFAFRQVQGTLPLVVFSQPGLAAPYLRAEAVAAQFVQAEPAADLAVQLGDGLFRFPDGTVEFEVATASLDDTRFADLDGVWEPTQPGYGVTATGRALGVNLADVAFLTPEGFPETGTATFAFAVAPAAPNDTEVTLTELVAESDGTRVLGSFTATIGEERFEMVTADLELDPLELALVEEFLGGEPLPYGGSLSGSITGSGGDITFDLVASLTADEVTSPFQADVTGRVRMTAAGFELRQVDVGLDRVPLAALRAFAPALPVDGLITGRVSLSGLPGQVPLDVDVRLELGTGVALVAGTVDLTGEVPRYDLTGSVLGVDLESILAPAVPPVALTARFALAGSGFDPATMNADITAAGRFTGWQTTASDTLHLVAAVRSGTLAVSTLLADVATAHLAASGDWRFIEPQSGAITYELAVSEMEPFGPYLPVLGDSAASGRLAAAGSVTGTLDRLRLTGSADGADLAVGGWQAASLDAEYDLLLGGSLPEGRLTASVTELGTPTAGAYEEGDLILDIAPPSLAFELNARREDGGLVEVLASGDLPPGGPRRILVQQARFDLADDRWALLAPATITWSEDGLIDIDDLVVESENTDGRLRLSGRVLPRGRIDANFEIVAFPMGDVQRLLGQPARIEGVLSADGTIRGGTDNPAVDITFSVANGSIDEIELRSIGGRVAYLANETVIEASVMVDSAGMLNMEATLPSQLSLDEEFGFALLDGIPLSGTLTARDFALAPLAAGQAAVRDVTGTVNADVTLGGTAETPQVDGLFTLADGAMTVVNLNQRYTEITGQVDFDGRQLVLEDVRARSDGWAVLSGAIVLERLDQPVLDLAVTFDEFRPIGVEDQSDAAVFGQVEIDGGLDAITVSGAVTVEDGYVVIPEFGGGLGAELADITRPLEPTTEDDPIGSESLFENLRIANLRVTAGDGAWFVAAEARAQLTGELVVNKSGDAMPITGTLTGTRGQYTLVAGPLVRRFEIVAALVRFRGLPEPNPLVEITARRIVLDPDGRQLDVDVLISGTLDEPQLSLAGGTTGMIAESELLSFLLFGQSGLTGGELLPEQGGLLEQTLFGGVAELMALELERSLGGLGFDLFQIRFGPGALGGLGAPTFVVGWQLRDDVFLTAETGIGALFGGEAGGLETLAIRLDWAFDSRSRLRLALEPVYRGRALRSAGLALPLNPPKQQWLIEVRRRWIY